MAATKEERQKKYIRRGFRYDQEAVRPQAINREQGVKNHEISTFVAHSDHHVIKAPNTPYDGTKVGKTVTAAPLSYKPRNTVGSPAKNSIHKELMNAINQGGSSYARGHLLGDQLHGPGDKEWNLTPIPQTQNLQMVGDIEGPIAKAINRKKNKNAVRNRKKQNQVYYYQIDAQYNEAEHEPQTIPHKLLASEFVIKYGPYSEEEIETNKNLRKQTWGEPNVLYHYKLPLAKPKIEEQEKLVEGEYQQQTP